MKKAKKSAKNKKTPAKKTKTSRLEVSASRRPAVVARPGQRDSKVTDLADVPIDIHLSEIRPGVQQADFDEDVTAEIARAKPRAVRGGSKNADV